VRWLITVAKALIKSPVFVWAWIRSKPVSFEVASARLAICNNCDELDLITRQCKKCWCFVGLKVRWQYEKCPLNRWP